MAGRGRGRGASFTFDLQAIGFSKGESLPETQLQPLPIFPSVEFKPAPLREGDDIDYVLELKQDLRATMKKMPYFIDDKSAKPRVEKYRTKYEIEAAAKLVMEWTPDWRLLPREMKAVKKTVKKRVKKSKVTKPSSRSDDVLKKIEELEKKGDEKSDEENEEKKKEGEEDEEEVEQEIEDEEEHEEENDYIASYFEDGDDFAASDDNMDEATY